MIYYYKNWDYTENKCMCGALDNHAVNIDSYTGDVDPYLQMNSDPLSTLDICPSYEDTSMSYSGYDNSPCVSTGCTFAV